MFYRFIKEEISYPEALAEQETLTAEGKVGWLLFVCKPTITLGLRAESGAILTPEPILKEHGVDILKVNRGGFATFHGPGQIVGFPVGKVGDFTGDPRGVRIFVEKLLSELCDFIAEKTGEEVTDCRPGHPSGVWIVKNSLYRKVVALGMSFHSSGMKHGFAMNVFPSDEGTLWGFGTITPCAEKDGLPGYIFNNDIDQVKFNTTIAELSERLQKI